MLYIGSSFSDYLSYNCFFRRGEISGACASGYYCISGAIDYNPMDIQPDPVSGNCTVNTPCAGPCPAGFYCPEGAEMPVPCPEHTIRTDPGARMFNECLPCPAGYWCHAGM